VPTTASSWSAKPGWNIPYCNHQDARLF
jgi:hypothetical protein